nr:CTD nuclear envelope phosphatase 1 homolog [Tanacetum cinerariifolium]
MESDNVGIWMWDPTWIVDGISNVVNKKSKVIMKGRGVWGGAGMEYREHVKDLSFVSTDFCRMVIVDNNPFSLNLSKQSKISSSLEEVPQIVNTAASCFNIDLSLSVQTSTLLFHSVESEVTSQKVLVKMVNFYYSNRTSS